MFGAQFAAPHFLNVQDSMSPTSPTPPVNSKGSGGGGGGGGNLAVSPMPARERIPSPQEMAIHAQQIMQNALIRRKLEEQKENFRRRQEHDQQRKSTDSPAFAFTPTVVMKKMAADRRDSDPKPVIPELKVSTQQPEKACATTMNMQTGNSPGGGGSPRATSAAAAAVCGAIPAGPQGMMQQPPPPTRPMPPAQQQHLLFMQQQLRAQQLAALQVSVPIYFNFGSE